MSTGSFQLQHEQTRMQPRRLREVRPPKRATSAPRTTSRPRHRAARRLLLIGVRTAANKLRELGDLEHPELERARLAQQSLRLFHAGKRELGTDSPIALSHLLAWALQTSAAQTLTLAAAAAGIASDRGARMLEQAARCQGRAERSSVAAASFAELLAKPSKKPNSAPMRDSFVV